MGRRPTERQSLWSGNVEWMSLRWFIDFQHIPIFLLRELFFFLFFFISCTLFQFVWPLPFNNPSCSSLSTLTHFSIFFLLRLICSRLYNFPFRISHNIVLHCLVILFFLLTLSPSLSLLNIITLITVPFFFLSFPSLQHPPSSSNWFLVLFCLVIFSCVFS